MAIEVKIPPMGESVTGGILAAWRVKDGDFVERDQILFELETDKITTEGLAEAAGRITLKAEEGDEVSVGQVVAAIDESAAPAKGAGALAAKKADPAPSDDERADEKKELPDERLSPAVRRIAAESGIDPSTVKGSGKEGRVTKGDMLTAIDAAKEQKAEIPSVETQVPSKEKPPEPAPAPPTAERTTRRKLTPLRQRIAQRLVASQRESAMLTTFNEADLSAIKSLRGRYQEKFVEKHGIKLGFMSFFVKAVTHALKAVPQVNAQLDGDTLVQNHYYDIGVAVSTEKGLLVPVVRDCDRLGLADLERAIATYAKRAREGKIKIEDLEGGVFTITNGGIFGSLLSTPIVNPPQSAILGMHAIQDRPVAVKGEVVIRPMMYLALSYDHRIIDGAEAVTFLVRVKEAIEDPARLLLEV